MSFLAPRPHSGPAPAPPQAPAPPAPPPPVLGTQPIQGSKPKPKKTQTTFLGQNATPGSMGQGTGNSGSGATLLGGAT